MGWCFGMRLIGRVIWRVLFTRDVSEREAVVGVGASYAKFVVEGTSPHEISPVNGGVLAFQVAGKMVFTSLVHHPGTKPNKWMDEAAAETEAQVALWLLRSGGELLVDG